VPLKAFKENSALRCSPRGSPRSRCVRLQFESRQSPSLADGVRRGHSLYSLECVEEVFSESPYALL
jgi:hypothetical protein